MLWRQADFVAEPVGEVPSAPPSLRGKIGNGHSSEQSLMHHLRRRLGIDIQAARNGALHDLAKEINPASLADLLGYSTKIMNIHAARAAVPMATYPAIKTPRAHPD